MKLEDLEQKPIDVIRSIKDEHMERYIKEVLSIRGMGIIHNTKSKGDSYNTYLHKREGMQDGNVLYIEYIGEIMEKVFGHNYRSTSVYGTFGGDSQYGEPYLMLPYGGEYSFCYSADVNDMYFDYHRIKMETYDEIYDEIKSNPTLKGIWIKFEHTVQGMKNSLQDYATELKKSGMDEQNIKDIISRFEKGVISKYNDMIKRYNVTNSLVDVYKEVGKQYHPMVEIMVKSPKYFMVSISYIMKNYRDIDIFLESI